MTLFCDQIHLTVQAGNGGNGCDSYFRRTDKKLVPHGGDGGKGGRVIFRALADAPSLASLRMKQRMIAESGGHGGSNKKRGKNGKDLIVNVPLGTRIYDRKRNLLIRQLIKENDEVIALEGGRPGLGNQGGKEATQGEKGAMLEVELSYRILADCFLIGLPNSGKTTLLKRLTRAQTKEEDYPFATKSPQIGVCALSDYENMTLCELPSLYRHSHEGRGMGTDFLKHLEHAKILLFVLDPVSEFSDNLSQGLSILRREIELYDKTFLDIPYAVVVNKVELSEAKEKASAKRFDPGVPCFFISAKMGEGIEELISFMRQKLESNTHA